MKKIRIDNVEGYYYVEDGYLCYSCNDLEDDVDVSDLTELKVWEYNELVKKLWVYYPDYNINKLKGRFI